jgi:hypothetical protein
MKDQIDRTWDIIRTINPKNLIIDGVTEKCNVVDNPDICSACMGTGIRWIEKYLDLSLPEYADVSLAILKCCKISYTMHYDDCDGTFNLTFSSHVIDPETVIGDHIHDVILEVLEIICRMIKNGQIKREDVVK